MTRKIPPEAFSLYFSLGTARSYEAVAAKYGVSKRAVTKRARLEGWQAQLEVMERQARERAEKKAIETLDDMNERHLKTLKFVQGKAIEALRSMSLKTAMEAVRALAICLEKERDIRGDSGDQSIAETEERVRREFEAFMVPAVDQLTIAGAPHLRPQHQESAFS